MPRTLHRLFDVRDTLLAAAVLAAALTGCREVAVAQPPVASAAPKLSTQPSIKLAYEIGLDDLLALELDRTAAALETALRDQQHFVDVSVVREGTGTIVVRCTRAADLAKLDAAFVRSNPDLIEAGRTPAKLEARFRMTPEAIARLGHQSLSRSIATIKHRVDNVGILSPSVEGLGSAISVTLPGVGGSEVAQVKRLLARTARLELHLVHDSSEYMRRVAELAQSKQKEFPGIAIADDYWQTTSSGRDDRYLRSRDKAELARFVASLASSKEKLPADHEIVLEHTRDGHWRTYFVYRRAELTGEHIADAEADVAPNAPPMALLRFNAQGAALFESLTKRNIGRKLAIMLDGEVMSAPVVQAAITGGNVRITMGAATDMLQMQQDAKDLVAVLRSGALTAPLKLISETQTK